MFKKTTGIFSLGLAIALLAFTVASATGTSIIKTCVDSSGHFRLITGTAKCTRLEKPLSWNQQGPKGDQGIQGLQGIQGIPGIKGDQGLQGPSGSQFVVVDANGQEVGIASGTGGEMFLRKMGNYWVSISIAPLEIIQAEPAYEYEYRRVLILQQSHHKYSIVLAT